MDEELKTYLQRMEERITEGMEERIAERVAGQIDASEGRIKAHIAGQIDASEERMKAHVSEQCHAVETRLLTAFHNWSKPYEMRVRSAVTIVNSFDERMALMEERISELERHRGAA